MAKVTQGCYSLKEMDLTYLHSILDLTILLITIFNVIIKFKYLTYEMFRYLFARYYSNM